jgi:hypothetical protein
LEEGLYEVIGKMIAYIMVHRGPLPRFLHPQLLVAIGFGLQSAHAELDDICDEDLKSQLRMVCK